MNLLAEQLLYLVRISRDVLEILGQKINGPRIQRIERDPRAFMGKRGEHQHRRWAALHDLPDGGDTVHHWHLVIHGDDVRFQRQRLVDSLAPVGRGSDHLDIRV